MRFKSFVLAVILAALPVLAQQKTTGSYTITVIPAPPALVLSPGSGALANTASCGTATCAIQVGLPYSASITVSGGTAPYTATLTSGALPAGVTMALTGSTIAFAGTVTALCSPSPCSFTVTVIDSSQSAQTVTFKSGPQVAESPSLGLQPLMRRKLPFTLDSAQVPMVTVSASTMSVVLFPVKCKSMPAGDGCNTLTVCDNGSMWETAMWCGPSKDVLALYDSIPDRK